MNFFKKQKQNKNSISQVCSVGRRLALQKGFCGPISLVLVITVHISMERAHKALWEEETGLSSCSLQSVPSFLDWGPLFSITFEHPIELALN